MPTPYLSDRQQLAADRLAKAGRGIAWWKIGEGKTRIALGVHHRMYPTGDKGLLVVCSPQAFAQWEDERDKCPWRDSVDLRLLSYGLLSARPSSAFLERLKGIGLLVLDELWQYKNVRSKRTIRAGDLARGCPTLGLSGSLITARNIEDLYGQAYAVGVSSRVASSLTHFRSQFCVTVEEFGLSYYAKKGALPAIQQRLADHVDIYFPKDVRESRYQSVQVSPSREQFRLQDKLIEDYYAQFPPTANQPAETVEVKNSASLISKLQQLSDGILLTDQGNTVQVRSPKLDRLLQLLADYTDSGQRVIVWTAFKASVRLIANQLKGTAATLSGDDVFDREGWKGGRYKFCIATMGSGASLNDFTDCQYAIVYSAPYSHRAFQQSLGRTNRIGSPPVCYYTLMGTKGGVDHLVYDSLRITKAVEDCAIRSSTEVIRIYLASRKT